MSNNTENTTFVCMLIMFVCCFVVSSQKSIQHHEMKILCEKIEQTELRNDPKVEEICEEHFHNVKRR